MKRRLKIFHLLLGNEFGGATVIVKLLSENQQMEGHDVFVLVNDIPGVKEEFIKHGIKLVDDKGITGRISPMVDIFHLVYLLRFIAKNNFDIVHTHAVKAGFIGRCAAWLAGQRCIVHSIHGYGFEEKYKNRTITKSVYVAIEKLLSKSSAAIIASSRKDFETALQYGISDTEKLKVVNNGIDLSRFHSSDHPDSRKYFRREMGLLDEEIAIGVVARLHKAKGHRYLIDAASILLKETKSQIRFILVGDGPEKEQIQERISVLGMDKYFILLGHRRDISWIMQGIDMHLLPSLREGFPTVLLEVMAAAKPCITTDVGGCAEAVLDGITGYVIPPGDPVSMVKAMTRLIEDKELSTKMGENGYQRLRTKFLHETMCTNIEDIYLSCLEDKLSLC